MDWERLDWRGERLPAPKPFEEDGMLDKRLVAALQRKDHKCPRPVQMLTIPSILKGKDCLIRSPTGTGKTLAYAIPIVNLLLKDQRMTEPAAKSEPTHISWRHGIKALILVPSSELVQQVQDVLEWLCFHCGEDAVPGALTAAPTRVRELASAIPVGTNILISHPGAIYKSCRLMFENFFDNRKGAGTGPLTFFPNLGFVVVDEADLILSVYGFKTESCELFRPDSSKWRGRAVTILPSANALVSSRAQTVLASATLNEDLNELRALALFKPSVLHITYDEETPPEEEDEQPASSKLWVHVDPEQSGTTSVLHTYIHVNRSTYDDFLVVFGALRDSHLTCSRQKQKVIIFADTIERACKLEITLKALNINCLRVCATQPFEVRMAHINTFNQGLSDVLIASDSALEEDLQAESEENAADEKALVSRGLDFKHVTGLVNFDCPTSLEEYIHRIGRCGREALSDNVVFSLTLVDPDRDAEQFSKFMKEVETSAGIRLVVESGLSLARLVKYRYQVDSCVRKASRGAVKRLRASDAKTEAKPAAKRRRQA